MSGVRRDGTLDLLYELRRDLERKIQPIQEELERLEDASDALDAIGLDSLAGGLFTLADIAEPVP